MSNKKSTRPQQRRSHRREDSAFDESTPQVIDIISDLNVSLTLFICTATPIDVLSKEVQVLKGFGGGGGEISYIVAFSPLAAPFHNNESFIMIFFLSSHLSVQSMDLCGT